MVAIVVVSHSRQLARAAVALAREMVPEADVHLGVAAGVDDGSGGEALGTDAAAVAEAIVAADAAGAGSGVVVLMDLGSAVLSAGLALELLADDALAARVDLCAAPFVEGLVAAAVTAAGGGDRSRVVAEATAALSAKQAHLGTPAPPPPAPEPRPAPPPPGGPGPAATAADDVRAEFVVRGEHGLHARPAALLVRALAGLDAVVEVRNLTTGAGPVPANSLLGLATLGAEAGHRLAVAASGPQSREALDRVLVLVHPQPPP